MSHNSFDCQARRKPRRFSSPPEEPPEEPQRSLKRSPREALWERKRTSISTTRPKCHIRCMLGRSNTCSHRSAQPKSSSRVCNWEAKIKYEQEAKVYYYYYFFSTRSRLYSYQTQLDCSPQKQALNLIELPEGHVAAICMIATTRPAALINQASCALLDLTSQSTLLALCAPLASLIYL